MESAAHLRGEDRPEFDRILTEALYSERLREALQPVAESLNPEQLRTAALSAGPRITATAAEEYAEYLAVRDRVRSAENAPYIEGARRPLGAALSRPGSTARIAGAGPVMAVLTPVLSGAAAVIFLLVGWVMSMFHPEPPLANSLLTAGWLFAAISICSVIAAMAALLWTALRHSSGTRRESPANQAELDEAKTRWRAALMQNGLYPFLLAEIRAAGEAAGPGSGEERPGGLPEEPAESGEDGERRRPGFSSPGFSTLPESLAESSAGSGSRFGRGRSAPPQELPEDGGDGQREQDDDRLESRTSRMMRRLGRPRVPRGPRG